MTLNLAFYGAGDRARPYLDALSRLPDVNLVAVCDLDRRVAEEVAAGWRARVFLSYEAMLQEARPDALWICVPPHLQGDVLLRAAEQRMPFFVEPPGAMDYARARLYGRLAAEARLVTAVGFPTRYTDVVHEAREFLGTNPVPLILGCWLRPAEGDGVTTAAGLLWNDACRFIDALRHFCGEIVQVHALAPGSTEGGLIVQLRFASGSVGVLTCATFGRPEPRVELELLGEGWSLGFGEGFSSLRLVERDRTTFLRRLNTPAADSAAAFLQAVAAGDPALPATSYQDALATMTVCHAAALSAQERRPVDVDEVEHLRPPTP